VYVSQLDVDTAETKLVVVLAAFGNGGVLVVDAVVTLDDPASRVPVGMEPDSPI
jgi:hypothetical protein